MKLESGYEQRVNTSDLLINTLFLGLIFPTILSALLDFAVRVKTNNGFIWVNLNSSNYKKLSLVMILLILVGCVVLNLLSISRVNTPKFPLVRAISLLSLIYVVINYLYMPDNWYSYQVITVCVFWVYGIFAPLGSLSQVGETFLKIQISLALSLAALFALAIPSRGVFTCRSDKCGIFGNLWMGFFPHENALGFFSIVCVGLSFLFKRKLARNLIILLATIQIFASGSRLALIALGSLILFNFLNKTLLSIIPMLVMLISLILFLTVDNPLLLTGRGGIWMRVKQRLNSEGWIFGQGMGGFQTGQSKSIFGFTLVDEQSSVVSIISRYGAFGVVFFFLFLGLFFFYREYLEKKMLVLLATFSVAMISESFAVPTFLNFYSFIYFLCLMQTRIERDGVIYEIGENEP